MFFFVYKKDKIANSKFNQKTWEDLIMKLLSNSLDQINDEEFVCDIAKSMGRHIEALYPSLVDEKVSFLLIRLILKIKFNLANECFSTLLINVLVLF